MRAARPFADRRGARLPSSRSGRQAGITLIELMVALAVTSIVAAAILGVLASGSTLFRDAQANADAQGNLRWGADRMARDLRLAGFGGPNNSTNDPMVRGGQDPNWVAIKRNANGIYSYGGGVSQAAHTRAANASYPLESITILGDVSNAQRQMVTQIASSGAITLTQPAAGDPNYFDATTLAVMYPTGAPVALWTKDGAYLGTVSSVSGLQVTMTPAPIPTGYSGAEAMLAPLRFIRYSIQNDAAEPFKTDLIREQVNADGSAAAYSTKEVVAEYAVGLQFSFCRANTYVPGVLFSALPVTCGSTVATSPEQIRGLSFTVWLRANTETKLQVPAGAAMSDVGFSVSGTANQLAPVRRTMVAIELPNIVGGR